MAKGVKTGGRKKGTPNKDRRELLEMIEATGCVHPIQGMAEIAVIARQEGNIDLAHQAYKELAPYVASKRKAVEHSGHIESNQPLVIILDDDQTDEGSD